jgi:hypothetical protein
MTAATPKDRHGTHQAVLAVNIPGGAPYAVFKPRFKHPHGKGNLIGAGLPALVSSSDPSDVEVLWDEMLSIRGQDRQTRNAALRDANERVTQFETRMTEVSSGGAPAPPVAPGPPRGRRRSQRRHGR